MCIWPMWEIHLMLHLIYEYHYVPDIIGNLVFSQNWRPNNFLGQVYHVKWFSRKKVEYPWRT